MKFERSFEQTKQIVVIRVCPRFGTFVRPRAQKATIGSNEIYRFFFLCFRNFLSNGNLIEFGVISVAQCSLHSYGWSWSVRISCKLNHPKNLRAYIVRWLQSIVIFVASVDICFALPCIWSPNMASSVFRNRALNFNGNRLNQWDNCYCFCTQYLHTHTHKRRKKKTIMRTHNKTIVFIELQQ